MKTIAEDTPLMPQIIAEEVTQDPDEVIYLTDRAEIHYQNNEDFRKSLRGRGNKGRDALYTFMEHWHLAYLNRKKTEK